jgi:hypothetical protein
MPRFQLPSRTRVAGALCATGLSLLLVAPTVAQDATPATGEIISGEQCTTDARPVTFLGELVATPVAQDEYVAPTAVPEGVTPDDATVDEITAVVEQFIACSNSGEVLRALSLFDDAYLRRVIDPTGELDPDTANKLVESIATPIAIEPEQFVVFLGIREMVQLPDGSVAVVLETDGGDENTSGTDVDLFIFKRDGDRWIIADAVNDIDDIEAQQTPQSGS